MYSTLYTLLCTLTNVQYYEQGSPYIAQITMYSVQYTTYIYNVSRLII